MHNTRPQGLEVYVCTLCASHIHQKSCTATTNTPKSSTGGTNAHKIRTNPKFNMRPMGSNILLLKGLDVEIQVIPMKDKLSRVIVPWYLRRSIIQNWSYTSVGKPWEPTNKDSSQEGAMVSNLGMSKPMPSPQKALLRSSPTSSLRTHQWEVLC